MRSSTARRKTFLEIEPTPWTEVIRRKTLARIEAKTRTNVPAIQTLLQEVSESIFLAPAPFGKHLPQLQALSLPMSGQIFAVQDALVTPVSPSEVVSLAAHEAIFIASPTYVTLVGSGGLFATAYESQATVWPEDVVSLEVGTPSEEVHESATSEPNQAIRDIENDLGTILREGAHEDFEAGMESNFNIRIDAIINQYGNQALDVLHGLIADVAVEPDLLAEIYRTIGRRSDATTLSRRFSLLLFGLSDKDPTVRDSAALGFADMEEAAAIPYLRQVASHEHYKSIRQNIEQVIGDLEEIVSAAADSEATK